MDQNAIVGKSREAITIKGYVEKSFGRSDGVGTVDDDDVITAGRGLFYPLESVGKVQCGTRIVVRFTQLGKEFFGSPRHTLIDIDLLDLLDGGVAQYLA